MRDIDYAKNAYAYAPRETAGGDPRLDSEGKDDLTPTIYDAPTIDATSSSVASPGGADAPSSGDATEPKVDNVIPEEGIIGWIGTLVSFESTEPQKMPLLAIR